jgi:hypothetical protein
LSGGEPVEGFVAEVGKRRREVALAQKLEEGTFGGFDAGGGKSDFAVVENDGLAVDGTVFGVEAAGADGGFLAAGGAADGEEFGETEFVFDAAGKGTEIAVVTEKAAAGGLTGIGEVGREATVRGGTREKPFEGDAGVEGEELAEAFGKTAVTLEGGIVDGDAVVGEVFFQTAVAGGDLFFAGRERAVLEGVVQGGGEVGEAGAKAQADEEGAGVEGAVGNEFFGGGGPPEGGRVGALFPEALAAAEFAEEKAPGVGGEEAREGDGSDGEGGSDGDDAVEGEVGDELSCEEGGVGGFFEDGLEGKHGGKREE